MVEEGDGGGLGEPSDEFVRGSVVVKSVRNLDVEVVDLDQGEESLRTSEKIQSSHDR